MGAHQPGHSYPTDLDVRDPDFRGKLLLLLNQQQCDIAELIARTKETLAASRALMDHTDRLLAWR